MIPTVWNGTPPGWRNACAIVVAGGDGEMYSLTVEEAVNVVERIVRVAGGRMPVFGTLGFNAAMAGDMARRMEKAGADGLLVMPPYFPGAPDQGLEDYYQAVASSSGLPSMGYSQDWAIFTPAMVARLAERLLSL